MTRMTAGEKGFQLALVVFFSVFSAAMLYPFVHELAVSFSTPVEAIRPGLHIFPLEWSLEAYKTVFVSSQIWIGFGNTIFRTVVGTLLSLIFMSMVAYPLSKKYLPHRTFYTMLIVFTMFFQGGLIPTYLLIKQLGLINSHWVYVLAPPFLISTFSMLILRNFFMQIPSELEDSAKMDGASDIRVLVSLILPLSKPILATVGLWSAVNHWNAWFDGLLYIQDPAKMVLQIYLRRLVVENQTQEMQALLDQPGVQNMIPETIKAATLMVATIPILIVYPFLQKYFVKGIFVGSLKG
ncbi:carbohydrate ABC transporter permease [Paenibacillus allorhizosphaerae]|uniref:L-arabinose transport system permease protein AraQ n=1 Tax=Paenibacillus allorhizosphaerae TaxID=2849866 RepID=A0ABN7TLE2_9BACL|nr:carbohydrate ABC transporter permease [Paenibacillus allorhizosphaerae]CAG7645411.1 L-arabinose transport system permease protein AraQ [Paenibacillus allorhizosphaerae]